MAQLQLQPKRAGNFKILFQDFLIRDNTNGQKSCPRTNSKVHAARYTFHIGADAKLYSTDSHSLYDGVEDFCIDQRNDRNTYGEENNSYYYNYSYEENDLNSTIMEDENSIPDSNHCKNSNVDEEALPSFASRCARAVGTTDDHHRIPLILHLISPQPSS